jgi:Domain of unknown function (DUF3387)
VNRYVGNLPPMPGVFPDYPAPVLRNSGADRELTRMRWGLAHELVTVIKGNVSVDWMHRDSARANIRRHVKRLLRKYGYPPDLRDAAVHNVLQQAEALSAEWAA